MSWIDKKYKDELGEQNFPEALKQKGWSAMEKSLDQAMPASQGGGGAGVWAGTGKLLLIVALLAVPLIWYLSTDTENTTATDQTPVPAESTPDVTDGDRATNRILPTEGLQRDPLPGGVDLPNEKTGQVQEHPQITDPVIAEEPVARMDESQSPVPAGSKATLEVTGSKEKATVPVAMVSPGVERETLTDADKPALHSEPEVLLEQSRETTPLAGEVSKEKVSSVNTKPTLSGSRNSPDLKSDEQVIVNQDLRSPEERSEEPDLTGAEGNKSTQVDAPEEKAETSRKDLRTSHLAFRELHTPVVAAEDLLLFSRERFSLSLWAGYGYAGKILQADNTSYLEKRQAEEKAIWTLPTGVDLDYFINARWTFGTGLRWIEYGEELNYNFDRQDTARIDGRFNSVDEFSNVVQVDSVRVIEGIFKGHWDYTVVYMEKDSLAEKNNGRTTWQYVEIPFTVGYRMGEGRIRPWFRTGISLGIPIRTSFRYLNTEATYLEDSRQNNEGVAPLQYNYLLSIGVDYYLSRSFSLRLNGLGSMQINSGITREGVRQRYYHVGMSLGLAYNF